MIFLFEKNLKRGSKNWRDEKEEWLIGNLYAVFCNLMAEDKERESEQSAASWGTWEELLLACAVKRHGFKDWNSVAMEVQARSSLPHLLITAPNCELKFLDLKRRFTSFQNDAVFNQNGGGIADKIDNAIPWVDELRKLRVAELRREVQRYDVSIR